MDRTRLAIIWIVAAIFAVAAAGAHAAQAPVHLRYGFAPGEKLSVMIQETTNDSDESPAQGTSSQSSTAKEIAQEWQVTSVNPAGEAAIEMRYQWLRVARTAGPGINVVIDTRRSIRETNPVLVQAGPEAEPVIQKLEAMRSVIAQLFLGKPIRFFVSGSGHVRDVTGFDAIWENYRLKVEAMLQKKEDRAELDAAIEAFFGDDAVHKLFDYTLFVPFPAAPAHVGDEWSDAPTEFTYMAVTLPINRSYRLTAADGKGKIAIEGKNVFQRPVSTEEVDFKVSSDTLTARIATDPANGLLLKQEYAGKLEIEGYDRASGGTTMLIRVVSDIRGSIRIGTKASAEGDAAALFEEGIRLFKASQYEDAVKAFTEAAALKPGWPVPYDRIGLSYYFLHRYDDAIAALTQSIDMAPDRAEPYGYLGSVYNQMHREAEAVDVLKKAVTLDPRNLDAFMELGHACRETGKLEEALSAYKEVARSGEKKADGTWFVGITYTLMGRLPEAVDTFKETIRMKPDHFGAHYFLGSTYAAMEKYGEAVEWYQKAIALKPDETAVRIDLAKLYYNTGSYAKAVDTLKEVLAISPGKPDAFMGLGLAYVRLGDKKAAMEQYDLLKDVDLAGAALLLEEINK